jgi:molecular chaperone GrpE
MTEPEPSDPAGETEAESSPEGAVAESEESGTGVEGDTEPTEANEGSPVDDELVERVESGDPESIARELATLQLEVEGLEAELEAREEEVEELTSKLKRKQADFENYKKRMKQRREQEQQRATEGLVERLLDVRDNLERALDQDEDVDIRDGVASTFRQFDDVLAAENVEPIEPSPGDEVDPHRHEVLARVDSAEAADAIADVHRPGYAMGDAVLREAQVTVSNGEAAGEDPANDDTTGEETADDEESKDGS